MYNEVTPDAKVGLRRAIAPVLAGLLFAGMGAAQAQTTIAPGYSLSTFATGAAIKATGVDSLAVSGGDVFAGYSNGVDSAGAGGKATSTIAEYTLGGKLERTYKLVGGNDGLRVDPQTGLLWVLQNQDGNSVLDVINTRTGDVDPYRYVGNLHPDYSGYDDIVFKGDTAYLSATNPATPNDVVLYETSTRLPEPGDPVRLTSPPGRGQSGGHRLAGSGAGREPPAGRPGRGAARHRAAALPHPGGQPRPGRAEVEPDLPQNRCGQPAVSG